MKILHSKGPKTVVISSSDLGDKDYLLMLASHQQGYLTPMLHYRVVVIFVQLIITYCGVALFLLTNMCMLSLVCEVNL